MRPFIFLLALTILSCGQSDTKQKELELKEKELALKEKELEHKQNESNRVSSDSNNVKIINTDDDIPVPKVVLTEVADYRKVHPPCNQDLAASKGYGLDCGVLGNKAIEIHWANTDNKKVVSGYTVVNNNKTLFEGKLISTGIKKASGRKDILEFDETVYTYILREPKTSNKNGVFQLKIYRNDTYEYGEGTWISYDGMLYREIFLYDKFNPDF